jgi:hypothetical protein
MSRTQQPGQLYSTNGPVDRWLEDLKLRGDQILRRKSRGDQQLKAGAT